MLHPVLGEARAAPHSDEERGAEPGALLVVRGGDALGDQGARRPEDGSVPRGEEGGGMIDLLHASARALRVCADALDRTALDLAARRRAA